MARRWRFIAQAACIAALVFAFPSAGSAFAGALVVLTPSGPSPTTLTIPAGAYPYWINNDQVTHTVVFANGLCSLELAPGTSGGCKVGFPVGQYPYTVDGTIQASVVVNALPPTTVTLTARSHTLPKAGHLRLHGTLNWSWCCGVPLPSRLRVPIVVLARHDGHHAFHRLTTVHSETRPPSGRNWVWRLKVHPRAKTIYIAEVTYQPVGEQGERQARSMPFKVIPRR